MLFNFKDVVNIATEYDTADSLRVCPPLDEVMTGVVENQNPEETMLRTFFQGSRLV